MCHFPDEKIILYIICCTSHVLRGIRKDEGYTAPGQPISDALLMWMPGVVQRPVGVCCSEKEGVGWMEMDDCTKAQQWAMGGWRPSSSYFPLIKNIPLLLSLSTAVKFVQCYTMCFKSPKSHCNDLTVDRARRRGEYQTERLFHQHMPTTTTATHTTPRKQ